MADSKKNAYQGPSIGQIAFHAVVFSGVAYATNRFLRSVFDDDERVIVVDGRALEGVEDKGGQGALE